MRGGQRLAYLDSGATPQKPVSGARCGAAFPAHFQRRRSSRCASVDGEATDAYEHGRWKSRLRRTDPDELVYTKNATGALNLVSYALGDDRFEHAVVPGDVIVTTERNITPI